METMEIGGREYPIVGLVESKTVGVVPLVDIRLMSDYKWNLNGLQSRLEDPELYRTQLGEDMEATITMLREWLKEHAAEATERDQPLLKQLGVVSA